MIVQQIEYVYVPIPDSIFESFEIVNGGINAKGLVNGYIKNTLSLGQCNNRLYNLQQWQVKQLETFDTNNKKKR